MWQISVIVQSDPLNSVFFVVTSYISRAWITRGVRSVEGRDGGSEWSGNDDGWPDKVREKAYGVYPNNRTVSSKLPKTNNNYYLWIVSVYLREYCLNFRLESLSFPPFNYYFYYYCTFSINASSVSSFLEFQRCLCFDFCVVISTQSFLYNWNYENNNNNNEQAMCNSKKWLCLKSIYAN